jgi:hypothetical protein
VNLLAVRLTERDEKIFNLLFKLRYANAKQISEYLNCKIKNVYDRVEKLANENYIESTIVDHFNRRVYTNGYNIRKDHEINNYRNKVVINFYTIKHHLEINDVYIYLIRNGFKEEDIFSERDIFLKKIGVRNRFIKKVPDLVVKKEHKGIDRLIALEIETTQKNSSTIRDVFRNARKNTSYYGITYLCRTKGIKAQINSISKRLGYDYIFGITLKEFYEGVDFLGL